MKITAAFLFVLSLFSTALAHDDVEVGYVGIATCTAKLDGILTQVNFFQEVEIESEVFRNSGYYVQTIDGLQFLGKISLKEDQSSYQIEMRVLTSPSTVFATVNLPKNEKNNAVDIFSITFGKIWGTFKCDTHLF